MALTEYAVGSGVIGATEWSLTANASGVTSNSAAGIFQPFINLSGMLTGDEYQIKIYETINSASPRMPIYQSNLVGPQPFNTVFPSLILMTGWDMTAEMRAGTARNILWSIRRIQ